MSDKHRSKLQMRGSQKEKRARLQIRVVQIPIISVGDTIPLKFYSS